MTSPIMIIRPTTKFRCLGFNELSIVLHLRELS
jgi:hypothetical protein